MIILNGQGFVLPLLVSSAPAKSRRTDIAAPECQAKNSRRMGIPSQIARLLLREHRYKPIAGSFLAIGRQTVALTPAQALALVETELGIRPPVCAADLETDTSTRASTGRATSRTGHFSACFRMERFDFI